jgi:UDP-glucose 4-epimerase
MRVLITGAFGYLGGRLAQYLASQAGNEILLGSRRQTESPSWLPQAKVVQTRWESPASLEEICTDIDAAVHLAGMNAQDSAADPVAALTVNGVATGRLMQAAVHCGVKRFIYLSTAHVYGSPLTGIITEATCPTNLHPYASSHRAGEDLVLAGQQKGEIEGIVARLSNAFGTPAHKDADCWMLLVNDLCRQAAATQKMVLRTSGLQRRNFITISDTCRVISHFLSIPASKIGDGLFNVGSAWSPTILEMTERIAERIELVTGSRPEIHREEEQGTDPGERLDYRINKLTDTGFCLRGSDSDNHEIDGLIQFCLDHMTDRK